MVKKGKPKKKGKKTKVLTEEEKAELEAKKLEAEESKVKPPTYGWIKLTVSRMSLGRLCPELLRCLINVTETCIVVLAETRGSSSPLIQLV